MQPQSVLAAPPSASAPNKDLAPLAWILEDLRQSLPLAALALRRCVSDLRFDASGHPQWDDTSELRSIAQQFHQAHGALTVIGQVEAAKVLRAAQRATDYFVDHPAACTEEAVDHINRTHSALLHLLQEQVQGHDTSLVGLFPGYRAVTSIFSAAPCHPAELWTHSWHWVFPAAVAAVAGTPASDAERRQQFDSALLGCIRDQDPAAAQRMSDLCGQLAHSASDTKGSSYWIIAAGFFEIHSRQLLNHTVEVKRTMAATRGQLLPVNPVSDRRRERHAHELLFFCACAGPLVDTPSSTLQAVQLACGLHDIPDLDYESAPFVRRDPVQLSALRQQHALVAESWSALVNGQIQLLPQVIEQFAKLSEISAQCLPKTAALLEVLALCLDDLRRSGLAPSAAMAMEFAIASLTVDAVCEDPNPSRKQQERRCKQLIQRLQIAREGHNPPPLEDWMREVYNRAATQRSMDGLVHALRALLQHTEQLLEQYFNGSGKPKTLETILERLAQADGIFAMLEIEQAHLAVRRMREQIKSLANGSNPGAAPPAPTQAQWAGTLGALGFLTNMLAFQPSLAKEMFQFDDANGQLASALLPRAAPLHDSAPNPDAGTTAMPLEPALANDAEPGIDATENEDDGIVAIFLEEGRGVIRYALKAIEAASQTGPAATSRHDVHVIRRAFHTLKGGARMVELPAMGESAWAFEELWNAHLAQGSDMNPDLLSLTRQALNGFTAWMDAIQHKRPVPWTSDDFRASADALRLQGQLRPLGEGLAQGRTRPVMRAIGSLRLSENLFRVFATEASERIAQLRDRAARWIADENAPHLQAICDIAHTLHGSASTLGFQGLGALAKALEGACKQLAQDRRRPLPGQQLLDSVSEMERLVSCFTKGQLEDPDANVLAILHLFATPTPQEGGGSPVSGPETLTALGTVADVPIDTELWQVFQEEARELLPALGQALRAWYADPVSVTAPAQVRRILHTLKGSARLAGAKQLGEMAHELESSLASIPDGEAAQTLLGTALDTLDAIQSNFEQQLRAMATASSAAAGATPVRASGLKVPMAAGAPAPNPAPARAGQSLRVRAQHVDKLLDQSSEVLLVRSRMQARTEHLLAALDVMALNATRLREQLRELEMQSDLQMQSRNAGLDTDAQTMDPLELDRFTRLQEIARMMAESTDDLGSVQKLMRTGLLEIDRELALQNRQCRELQHGVLAMRLIAFDEVSDRLYAVVRQSAKQIGNSVRLNIEGGALEVDRGVLDRIVPCLEHVLRNAVVHGIEPPPIRLSAGKPATGMVWISIAQSEREMHIDVRDDGGGLRIDRVRAKAIALGLLAPDAELSQAQALALLVEPGFSTSDRVTELAGRGVGMDVVQSEVHALGGRLSIQSEEAKGMCFSMIFPLTTALAQVVLFRVGAMTFGVPGNLLEQCTQRNSVQIPQGARAARSVELPDGATAELFWAGDLLEGPDQTSSANPVNDTIAIFRSAGRAVALHVDQALGNREMIVKNLGPQLASMPGLVAISLLPEGDIVLIYNPIALATVYGGIARARQDQREAEWQAGKHPPSAHIGRDATVLVVDDSITMRRVTERILTHAGCRVVLASDGLDALEKLETTDAALILTDIEMPRMDGFDLVRQLRSQAGTANTPIIIISSRVGQKHRDIATRLGVQHYLGKPYVEAELLDLVRGYCTPASAAAV